MLAPGSRLENDIKAQRAAVAPEDFGLSIAAQPVPAWQLRPVRPNLDLREWSRDHRRQLGFCMYLQSGGNDPPPPLRHG